MYPRDFLVGWISLHTQNQPSLFQSKDKQMPHGCLISCTSSVLVRHVNRATTSAVRERVRQEEILLRAMVSSHRAWPLLHKKASTTFAGAALTSETYNTSSFPSSSTNDYRTMQFNLKLLALAIAFFTGVQAEGYGCYHDKANCEGVTFCKPEVGGCPAIEDGRFCCLRP